MKLTWSLVVRIPNMEVRESIYSILTALLFPPMNLATSPKWSPDVMQCLSQCGIKVEAVFHSQIAA